MISIGLVRGGRGKAQKERERKRENEDVKTVRRIGNRGRRGTASASPKNASPGSGEVLGPARFSRVRSALGKATFFFAVLTFRVLSGPYVALVAAPSRFSLFLLHPPPSYRLFLGITADCLRACGSSSPPDNAYPEARARARTRTRCVAREIAPRSANPSECRIAIA